MNNRKTLLIVINVDWLFKLHRLSIAVAAQKEGFKVIVAAKDTGESKWIEKSGIQFINLAISRSGTNPLIEAKLLVAMYTLYKTINPTIVYQITMKPVIYGSLISRLLNIKTVNAISGLGYNFTQNRRGFVQKIMSQLMRIGFNKRNNHLIFENRDDYNELYKLKIVSEKTAVNFSNGVGVDLNYFIPNIKQDSQPLEIILASRMLWDKGIKEFVEAAKLLKVNYFGKVLFKLVGSIDEENKEAVSKMYLKNNEIPNYIEWIGYQDNMFSIYKNTAIAVLPSYREGRPVVLLEACAMGIPIVTTNAIGCRDCVDEGINGFKVPVKSVDDLANAIEKLIINKSLRTVMGVNSRKKAENEFSQVEVINMHLRIFNSLLNI